MLAICMFPQLCLFQPGRRSKNGGTPPSCHMCYSSLARHLSKPVPSAARPPRPDPKGDGGGVSDGPALLDWAPKSRSLGDGGQYYVIVCHTVLQWAARVHIMHGSREPGVSAPLTTPLVRAMLLLGAFAQQPTISHLTQHECVYTYYMALISVVIVLKTKGKGL